MNIAVASGKGGTGKTTLAVALALANKDRARLLDCDVEEPNCHLFLGEADSRTVPVKRPLPVVDLEKCDRCGKCASFCQFNALSVTPRAGAIVFSELCHSCGGCARICPQGAIHEEMAEVGSLTQGIGANGIELCTGRLAVGHAAAPGVIKAVQKSKPLRGLEYQIMDAPPGTACPFMTTVGQADFVILVSESTPFGLHDVKLAMQALKRIGKPFGVVVNRARDEDDRLERFCEHSRVPVLLRIPESREMAECYARAGTLLDVFPELERVLRTMPARCMDLAAARSGL